VVAGPAVRRARDRLRAGHDIPLDASGVFSGLLMTPFETIEIDGMVAACAGGNGGEPLDHPKVYLNLAPSGRVECPYCSRLFVNRALARSGEARAEARPGEVAQGAAHG
jgi:uncharacterized Zn-finger protein